MLHFHNYALIFRENLQVMDEKNGIEMGCEVMAITRDWFK